MQKESNQVAINNVTKTGLLALALLQALMLAALYTRTPPHPPLEIPFFALGPFLSASIVLALSAHQLERGRIATGTAVAACLTALVSYGPQKYFDAAFPLIWPAVILAQLAVLAVLLGIARQLRATWN